MLIDVERDASKHAQDVCVQLEWGMGMHSWMLIDAERDACEQTQDVCMERGQESDEKISERTSCLFPASYLHCKKIEPLVKMLHLKEEEHIAKKTLARFLLLTQLLHP